MVRHIVIFRLKKELPADEKLRVMQAFKTGIEALPAVIDCIKQVEVGLNVNADEDCDICLNGLFATLGDVRAYSAHPAHRAVAGALTPHVAARSCVDYEV